MNEILRKRKLADNVYEYVLQADDVVKNAKPGQFVIVITDEGGERVPFTICDYDKEKGTLTLLIQTVGATTEKIARLNEGDSLLHLVGPLGNPTDLSEYKKVLLIGGGIGTAVIYPQSKERYSEGLICDAILGARDASLLMYEEEFRKLCGNVYIMTDNGSAGEKGFVTNKLTELINSGADYDAVLAVGPMPMMGAVCSVTRGTGLKTIVSMNTIMVDGTGMCGCCRLTVGGKTKYACVDGPEFDGHLVDFDEALMRSKTYLEQEKEHACRIRGNI